MTTVRGEHLLRCYAEGVTDAVERLPGAVVPPEWREHYAQLAAAWVREKGTLPPSLEELAEWGAGSLDGASSEAEIAYLEGRGSDPDPCP